MQVNQSYPYKIQRRHAFLAPGWLVLLLALLLFGTAPSAEPLVSGVDSVGITVTDLDHSVAFYRDVLDFELVSEAEVAGTEYEHLLGVFGLRLRVARMRLGEEYIELMQFLAPQGRPIPVDSRSNDHWFQHIAIIVNNMDSAYAQLRQNKVAHASPGPQTLPDWNPNAGGIKAFYFRDPDGNHLEILQFPSNKGAEKWHHNSDKLFLGIDHTAIVVHDTDAALRFYRDGLGLEVKGHSENYGIEQERLNNVFGARLLITAVAGKSGPAIEFLEYLTPRTGRPMPDDTRANDLWHWQIHLSSNTPEGVIPRITTYGGRLVSPGIVRMTNEAPFRAGVLGRGPTGHALLVFSSE